jgi:ACS family tartrate transporter-like MFS transporter
LGRASKGKVSDNPVIAPSSFEERTIPKLRIRLIPFLFLLYVVAFLDRTNISFASLTMNRELGITAQQFGFLAGIFFFGYSLFEVPSNLLLHKIGARVWIARILISWGAVAMLTGFLTSVGQLYVARFVLGVAEAGFFPVSCLSWKWTERSSVKITERAHAKRAKALHWGREGCHPKAALAG